MTLASYTVLAVNVPAHRRGWFVLLLWGTTVLSTAAGSASELPFRHYQTDDGLPQSQVLTLHQDRRGELWIGTWCGAARFDGARFRAMSQLHGMPSNYVREIVEDEAGDLWFAVGDGVARVDPMEPSVVTDVAHPLLGGTDGSPVRDLLLSSNGELWAATKHHGAAVRRESSWVPVPAPEIETDGFQLLGEDAEGILLGTLEGLVRLSPSGFEPWRPDEGAWLLPIVMVHAQPGEPTVFATRDGVWREMSDGVEELRTITGESIPRAVSTLRQSSGQFWIATENGLYRERSAGYEHLGVEQGLVGEHLYRLAEDREGNLWIGHDGGASRFSGEAFRTFLEVDGLPSASVWGLAYDDAGRLIVGTANGVAVRDADGFRTFHPGGPLEGRVVRAIVPDGEGGLVFGTREDGAWWLRGEEWRHLEPPRLPDERVFALHRDREGGIWLGTRRGLARWDATGAVRTWTRTEGLPHETIWQIDEGPDGRTTVATDAGIAVLEGDLFEVPSTWSRFTGVAVRNFVVRRDGGLWVGTNGAGVHHMEDGVWKVLLAGEGPSDDFFWGLTEDASSRMWLATNRGIDLFDGERWVTFSERDGLRASEIAVNAVLADPDGSTWFGFAGDHGLVRFAPDPFVREDALPPIVRIAELRSGDGKVFPEPERIAVPWAARDLTFTYIGISFIDERRVLYRTRLDGYDLEWSAETRGRSARYTNLSPGSYRFDVLAMSAAGVWSQKPASVTVEILPPFWATWWFRTLGLSALAGLVFLAYRIKVRRLRAERHRLEGLVHERTESLQSQVQETERLKELYRELSVTDPLTGLANRRHFVERFEGELARARRHGGTLGLLVLDVDHFKGVNDRYGHQAGDEVLVRLAETLRANVRATDVAGRYGGEEFVVLFAQGDADGFRRRADVIRSEIAAGTLSFGGHQVRITVSGGLTVQVYGEEAASSGFDELVLRADEALYRAKAKGRNRIETVGFPDPPGPS